MKQTRARGRGRRPWRRLAVALVVVAASTGLFSSAGVSAAQSGPPAASYAYDVTGSSRAGLGPFVFSVAVPSTARLSVSYARDCGVLVTTTKSSSETGVYCPSSTAALALYSSVQTMTVVMWHQSTTTTCSTPADMVRDGAVAGDSWPTSCGVRTDGLDNSTFQADGTVTYVGPETLTIGGESVSAFHGRSDVTFTGERTGSMVEDLWLDANGLPLKRSVNQKTVGAHKSTVFGMDYTATLRSLTPVG
ncbi:MAG: hypothetical protein U0U69_07255 [Acidimicrobiia bacterium]